jgi:hypothetical protein
MFPIRRKFCDAEKVPLESVLDTRSIRGESRFPAPFARCRPHPRTAR